MVILEPPRKKAGAAMEDRLKLSILHAESLIGGTRTAVTWPDVDGGGIEPGGSVKVQAPEIMAHRAIKSRCNPEADA